ncbi:hypothetical protein VP01_3760g2 [Puccinia sorghi]|uniref:Uncharacterized protein n=1 Tax=Puccinia sorghi TaxID=27349 RepID=A0A0L6UTR2_9BASI|nr:hypothetical protein VP01_3760g2 [Puccinia sorghi]
MALHAMLTVTRHSLSSTASQVSSFDLLSSYYENEELKLLIFSKMESVTQKNLVTASNRDSAKLLLAIKEHFASSQELNRVRIFNDFL